MSFNRYFIAIGLLYAGAVLAIASDISLTKRGPLLESRQGCRTPGWIPACPVGIPCVPVGAVCCDDGTTFVMPPETCPDGTHPVATASITVPTVPTITPRPTPPTDVIITRYTFTITWYYYYYYYYYVGAATRLTSSTITTQTTISVSATNSAAALASFSAISATIRLPTPSQGATSIIGTPTSSAYPTATPTLTPSPSPGYNATVTSGPEGTYSQVPIGAASSLTAVPGWGVTALGFAFALPAVLLVIL